MIIMIDRTIKKLWAIYISIIMLLSIQSITAFAAGIPPTSINPPQYLGTSTYLHKILVNTISAPDDLRAILGQTKEQRGYPISVYVQVDFKVDNGNWHYTSAWDDLKTYKKYAAAYYNGINDILADERGQYLASERLYISDLYPDEKDSFPQNYEWFKDHNIITRARFSIDFGSNVIVFSDWSAEYTLSAKNIMDHRKIMNNNAPVLKSSIVEKNPKDQKPYVILQLDKHPSDIQKLNAASANSMWTEVWLKKDNDKDFKKVGDTFFSNEKITLDVSAYFDKTLTDYASAKYDVKVRYHMDERAYYPLGATVTNQLYTPYSNILSYGMDAWSDASQWATEELKKADVLGLIPDSLKGADLTKPINRKEFAAVCVKVFENLAATKAIPSITNPFKDTTDLEVLKAYNAGITAGTATDEFSPDTLLNREQAATMLTRVFKRVAIPGWTLKSDSSYNLNYIMPPKFADDDIISDWAKPSVYFMVNNNIVSGVGNNKFAPKATTTAEQAKGYASATREQALVIAVRMVENLKNKAADYTEN